MGLCVARVAFGVGGSGQLGWCALSASVPAQWQSQNLQRRGIRGTQGRTVVADHVSIPAVVGVDIRRADAAWAPLRGPLFRSFWIAAVVSYTRTCMQNLPPGRLITPLPPSPFIVTLVQSPAPVPRFF